MIQSRALVASYARLISSDGQGAALEALAGACVLLGAVIQSDSLAAWNDSSTRTEAEVLAAFDEAASALAAGWTAR